MEGGGGGERKRKAATAEPDVDRLLSSGNTADDEVAPSVVEIKEAAVEHSGVEESESSQFLLTLPSTELSRRIARAKHMLPRLFFKDGGEKMRAQLKRLEVALERRKLLEDEEKCKMAAPLLDESTCTGAIDSSLSGPRSSIAASQSTFALRFCSNLDDKRAHGKTKPFGGKQSSVNRKMGMNGQLPSRRTHKIGTSSRHSESIDAPLQSNSAELQNQSSPELYHDDTPDTIIMEVPAPPSRPLRRTRQKNKPILLVAEADLEDDLKDEADKVGQSIKEKMIYYPARDNLEEIEIFYSHLECLAPLTYLSSTIMNFYIWYLQKPTSPTARRACNYHFFNTYFYNVLKRGGLDKLDKENFMKFRKWWKGVHIFEKAYVFLPIHDHFHWSLVIICIPDREDESGPVILHLDSLGLHNSKPIFDYVKSFLIEEWKFLRAESQCKIPLADKVWEKLSRRIHEKKVEVPQQDNEYDCGLFVLYFMERFILDAPERLKRKDLEMFGNHWFKPDEASDLRRKIKDMLTEEFENSDHYVCKRPDNLTSIVYEPSSLKG